LLHTTSIENIYRAQERRQEGRKVRKRGGKKERKKEREEERKRGRKKERKKEREEERKRGRKKERMKEREDERKLIFGAIAAPKPRRMQQRHIFLTLLTYRT